MRLTADSIEQGANLRGNVATLVTLQVTLLPTLLTRGLPSRTRQNACGIAMPVRTQARHLSCPVT
ncbi:MAG: hypothetical protein ABIO92_05380 [Chloroflexia bacterium]